jgi:hypothetical protein
MLIVVSLLLVTMALVRRHAASCCPRCGTAARAASANGSAANAMAVVSLPLFAARGAAAGHPVGRGREHPAARHHGHDAGRLSAATCQLPVPWRRLGACVALGLLVIVVLHHGVDSIGGRVVAMSLLHAVLCLEMGCAAVWPRLGRAKRRYPVLFTHLRGLRPTPPSSWCARSMYGAPARRHPLPCPGTMTTLSMVFFSVGALSMPA